MVQIGQGTGGSEGSGGRKGPRAGRQGPEADRAPVAAEDGLGRRARNRIARHRAYLATALRIATEEGLDALTMQRLADDLDSAVGTVYTYFPSKGAVVAEIQREAVERLVASYLLLLPDVERRVADEPPRLAALTHVVGFTRFWVASLDTFPQEQRLIQALVADAGAVPETEAARVLPAAWRLLGLARDRFERAAEVGALTRADALERTVVMAAGLNGVVQLGRLGRWDPDLLDGRRLAGGFVDSLLQGWGAEPTALAAAHAHLDRIARRRHLARPLPQDQEDMT
ncbi:MAG: TetR/AcrR family transcriptional regulator [Acidimicrobiia bacterium]